MIQRRLGCIFISNSLQESIVRTEVLVNFLNDHSLLSIQIKNSKELRRGSHCGNLTVLYCKIKILFINRKIKEFQTQELDNVDQQRKWDFLKCNPDNIYQIYQ